MSPAPAVTRAASAPVIEYASTSPAAAYAAPTPVNEYTAIHQAAVSACLQDLIPPSPVSDNLRFKSFSPAPECTEGAARSVPLRSPPSSWRLRLAPARASGDAKPLGVSLRTRRVSAPPEACSDVGQHSAKGERHVPSTCIAPPAAAVIPLVHGTRSVPLSGVRRSICWDTEMWQWHACCIQRDFVRDVLVFGT